MLNWKWALRRAQRKPSRTAYLKSYSAPPDFTFPDKFDLSDHNLLLSESIHSGTHTTVLLYWTSEERARAQEPIVQKVLGINNAQVLGQVVEVLSPIMPKWTENPVKWGKWLVSAAALFGAMSVIRDYFTELFAAPDVVIFANNSATANFHDGDPLDIPLVVRNQSPLGHAAVYLDYAHLVPLDRTTLPTTLQFDISQVPQLQAGQNADVHITGTSPRLRDPQPKPFALEVHATAKEGFFRFPREAAYHSFNIKFWPDRSWDVQVHRTSPAIASVEITLRPGVAFLNGLRGQLTFSSAVSPEQGGIVLMPGATPIGVPIVATGSSGSLAKILFQTGPLQPFHGYSYTVSISFGRPLTEMEWSSMRSSMKVVFA